MWKCKLCNSEKKSSHKEICHKCYSRKWNNSEKAKNYRSNYKDLNKTQRQVNYEKRNPHKIKAKDMAQRKIEVKGLCQKCHINKAEERHHPDYSKPLEVLLLCKRCHYNIHKEKRDTNSPESINIDSKNLLFTSNASKDTRKGCGKLFFAKRKQRGRPSYFECICYYNKDFPNWLCESCREVKA